jgi:hypothetical protein
MLEATYDSAGLVEAVRELRRVLGRARRVAIAVRLPLLLVKRVRLPALPASDRRRVLRLEPQRYFPVRLEELAVAVRDDDLVFAVREDLLAEWVRQLETLGPVDLVEPGPVALARALEDAGLHDAVIALDDSRAGTSVLDLRGGRLASVRRLRGGPAEATEVVASAAENGRRPVLLWPWTEELATRLGGGRPAPLPGDGAVPSPFLSAYGAALGVGTDLQAALLPEEQRKRIVSRRRRHVIGAALAAAAAAAFLLGSVEAWRTRETDQVTAEVRALERRAAPALALQRQVAQLDERAAALAGMATARPDPLRVLLLLSARLPRDAHLQSLRFAGGEWQIEGYARRAAAVTQALGSAPQLVNLRVMAASSRARVGEETNESFALAFRVAARP